MAIPNILTCKPSMKIDRKFIRSQLDKHGHIILKNTGIKNSQDFSKWVPKLIKERASYKGGQNPRDDLGDGILNVNTAEPPHISLAFHNELCYHDKFPGIIAFCCL